MGAGARSEDLGSICTLQQINRFYFPNWLLQASLLKSASRLRCTEQGSRLHAVPNSLWSHPAILTIFPVALPSATQQVFSIHISFMYSCYFGNSWKRSISQIQ